jgi:hypothetical protein
LNQILRALREATSVISGLSVEPTSPPSMNVVVRAGTAVIGGKIVSLSSDTQVAVPAPDPSYPRFDLVTLKSDGTIGYYTGSPEAAVCVDTSKPYTCVKPRPPTTPAGELALAEIWVPPGATAINTIIDRRVLTTVASFGSITTTGDVSVGGNLNTSAGYAVGGVTVIDSNRNLVGLNTVAQNIIPDKDVARKLGEWSPPLRWADSGFLRVKTVFINPDISQDLFIFYNAPEPRKLVLGKVQGTTSSIPTRNSHILAFWAGYWDGTKHVNYEAAIQHVMLSTAPSSKLSFMFADSEKMSLDNAGNLSVAGNATISGNAVVKGTLSVGDIEFKNGWRIVEDEKHGLLLVSPTGKRYRFVLQEVVE